MPGPSHFHATCCGWRSFNVWDLKPVTPEDDLKLKPSFIFRFRLEKWSWLIHHDFKCVTCSPVHILAATGGAVEGVRCSSTCSALSVMDYVVLFFFSFTVFSTSDDPNCWPLIETHGFGRRCNQTRWVLNRHSPPHPGLPSPFPSFSSRAGWIKNGWCFWNRL